MSVDLGGSCLRKKRYATEKYANKVRRRCERSRGQPLRVYFCDACGGWHLTHRVWWPM